MRQPDYILDMWEFHWSTMEQYNNLEGKWYTIRWNEILQQIVYKQPHTGEWLVYRNLCSEGDRSSPVVAAAYKKWHEDLENILLGSINE